MTGSDTLPTGDPLTERAREVLQAAWRPEGYTVPNADVYPHQWLWDSCFHAVAWAALGAPDRARCELTAVFDAQGPDGFVPHLRYWTMPDQHRELWRRSGASTITQPPMYGHAVAELARRGVEVPDELVDRAWAGLTHLLTRRPRPGGGIGLVHPWESGCDHSPRWDAWCPGGFDEGRWYDVKGRLVDATIRTRDGTPVANPAFTVASAGFDALVVFNAWELHEVRPEPSVEELVDEVAASLGARWDAGRTTWLDVVDEDDEQARPVVIADAAEPTATRRFTASSGGVRTLDALLPVLVDPREDVVDAVFGALRDPAAYGAPYGPTGVHRDEPTFEPGRYWRGAAWPQLTYLLWVAARVRGRTADAAWLADRLRAGAVASGFAEYWHPDDGSGRGAAPQSWTALAAVVGLAAD